MNVYLLFRDHNYKLPSKLPKQSESLIQDLELPILFQEMAQGDPFILETVRSVILSSLSNIEDIRYRQSVLEDCLVNQDKIKALYQLSCEAAKNEKDKQMGFFSNTPKNVLDGSIKTLELFVPMLSALSKIANQSQEMWHSQGFHRFFQRIREELSSAYLTEMKQYLEKLKFPDGILVSTKLGKHLKADHYALHNLPDKKTGLKELLFGKKEETYCYTIADRDESGYRILSELEDEGVKEIASIVSRACEHIRLFFVLLKRELSFYVGCMNLKNKLARIGGAISFPKTASNGKYALSCNNLYCVSLALLLNKRVEGNTVNGDGKQLVIVTGANQGGKTTFLRSIGQAYLMFQSGMFITGDSFSADVGPLFTHFKREEDQTMKSGKLDEELERMSQIVDSITPGSLLLMNESFAATNEYEGSEIAMQIVTALLNRGIRIIFVSHFYKFTRACYNLNSENYLFLRADRQEGGGRSFQMSVGEPLTTSFGEDIYDKIFQEEHNR